jgi:TP901 family phage tail tape measure protein
MAANLDAILRVTAKVFGEEQVYGLAGSLKKVEQAGKDAKVTFSSVTSSATWQSMAVAAAGVGAALAGSVAKASAFQGVLSEIGKTSGAGTQELQKLSDELLKLSSRDMTNLAPEKLARGVQDLVGAGLSLKDATASMEALGKVATATNSDLLDVTKTGFQLQNALKIKPSELKETFDALAFAGKQGAFELKDMAQYMPTIAAAAGTLGIEGKEGAISLAAMMQMVRKDAPDAAQSATRLTDAMLKMTAPDAVKNFKAFGVNIEEVLKSAKANGINPMEAALEELQRVTGGDVFKLGQIFGDKEAKLALMSLMKYREEFGKLKTDAANAAGVIDKDFEKSKNTFQGTLESLTNSMERIGISIGNALLPGMTALLNVVMPVIEAFAGFLAANPALAAIVVSITALVAGIVVLLPIIAAVAAGFGAVQGIILAIQGAAFAATIAGWLGAIGPMIAALGTFAAAIIGWPLVIGAALIAVGVLIYSFRDKIGAFLVSLAKAIGAGMAAIGDLMKEGIAALWKWLGDRFNDLGKLIGGLADGAGNILGSIGNAVRDAFMAIPNMLRTGINAALSWAASGVNGLIGIVNNFIGQVNRLASAVGLPGLPFVPTVPIPQFAGGGYTGNGPTVPIPQFAGGGYTGNGPRAGGIDGQGGFMAMLHPRETVIDHTRGQAGGRPGITIQTGPVLQQADGSRWVSMDDLERGMAMAVDQALGIVASPAGRMALGGA